MSLVQPPHLSPLDPVKFDLNDKSEQILQGAMQVFLDSGYAGTSMDRVASEAGVSKQTIYSHFQDKKGLFTALIERVTIRRFQIQFGLDGWQKPPEVLLRQLAETLLDKLDDPEFLAFFRLVIAESARFPELSQMYVQSVIQFGHRNLSSYFSAHPELQIADPEATTRIFFGSLVAFILSQGVLQANQSLPMDRKRLVDALVSQILCHAESEFIAVRI